MATNKFSHATPEATKHYAGVKFSPKGSSWDNLEKELFTPEEIRQSDLRAKRSYRRERRRQNKRNRQHQELYKKLS